MALRVSPRTAARMAAAWPFWAAAISAWQPSLSTARTSAPAASRRRNTGTWPACAANITAVHPSRSAALSDAPRAAPRTPNPGHTQSCQATYCMLRPPPPL